MPLYSLIVPTQIQQLFLAALPLAIVILGTSMQIRDYLQSGTLQMALQFQHAGCCDEYDFIVVGGGSAGSAVAARLTENPNVRVLLLEAGGDPNPFSSIPILTPLLINHPATDWGYKTETQYDSGLGVFNREIIWPKGKSLGGSSNSNFMLYNKGNPKDYERWAQYLGDSRWGFGNINNYFRRIEDYFGFWEDNGVHGRGGPQRIEKGSYAPGAKYILEAVKEKGYEVRDNNKDQKQGFSPVDLTQKRGLRYSAYRAYLGPIVNRKNLAIFRYTLATKIHFNQSMHAIGVSYVRHGLSGYVKASKEVIVCGGTINSPQLLMLSGIGPAHHLQENGIEPLADLPVGQNLQDHVATMVGPFLVSSPESLLIQRDISLGTMLEFIISGVGPFASSSMSAVGFTASPFGTSSWPDLMHTVVSLGVSPGIATIFDKMFNSANQTAKFLDPFIGMDSHFVVVSLGLPRSRGYIKLRNNNPFSKPIINPQYFSDPDNQDISSLIYGVQQIIELYENTTSLRKINGFFPKRNVPGCELFPFRSHAYFECLVRTVTMTLYDPTSTCPMGKIGDPKAVVDSQLRVLGTKNLRVADASVMPFIINANTNAASMVIGEMVSDMLKSSWNLW